VADPCLTLFECSHECIASIVPYISALCLCRYLQEPVYCEHPYTAVSAARQKVLVIALARETCDYALVLAEHFQALVASIIDSQNLVLTSSSKHGSTRQV